ncbi:MAG: class I SAM-dependent methyltransferase [Pelovirga sp.]
MNFDAKASRWDTDPKKIARAEAVAKGICAMVPLHAAMRTLEYGCGTGLLGFALQPHVGKLIFADSSPGMLDVVEQKIAAADNANLSSRLLDLDKDPAPPECFDLICSLMTLHHVGDYQGLLTKFYQLLHPGGYLCVADLDTEDGSFHNSDFAGHQGFDRDVLHHQLQQIGFDHIRFKTVFEVVRGEAEAARRYPVFLMVCRRRDPQKLTT